MHRVEPCKRPQRKAESSRGSGTALANKNPGCNDSANFNPRGKLFATKPIPTCVVKTGQSTNVTNFVKAANSGDANIRRTVVFRGKKPLSAVLDQGCCESMFLSYGGNIVGYSRGEFHASKPSSCCRRAGIATCRPDKPHLCKLYKALAIHGRNASWRTVLTIELQ